MGIRAGLFISFFVLEYLLGSLMFSFWLAKGRGKDLKKVRDGNPGAVNLWRAAGWRYGMAGLFLDYLKGFVPLVFIARSGLFAPGELTLLAIAPVLGHAFSPFMKFSGGKAIAVTFGVWSALTEWVVPTIMGTSFTLFSLARFLQKKGAATPEEDAQRLFWGMMAALAYILLQDRALLLLWVLNSGVLAWKHGKEIAVLRKKNTISGGIS